MAQVLVSESGRSGVERLSSRLELDFASITHILLIATHVIMADQASSGRAAELKEQEEELSARLPTAAQFESHGEALLQRSAVRSALGNHVGALEDAELAAALGPTRAKASSGTCERAAVMLLAHAYSLPVSSSSHRVSLGLRRHRRSDQRTRPRQAQLCQ